MFCIHCGQEQGENSKFCHSCGNQISEQVEPEDVSKNISHTPKMESDSSTISQGEYEQRKRKNRLKGILWLVLPIAGMAIILSAWAIARFVLVNIDTAVDSENATLASTVVKLINVTLSLIGIVDVVLLIIGIPLGIVYLSKKEEFPGMKYDPCSGRGNESCVPSEIKGWNWGAAGLTWIWGVTHRVWISFLVFIPFVNLLFWIYLGAKGNELAWRADKWHSVDTFLAVQKKWKPWGIIFFILGLLASFGSIFVSE